MSKSEPNSDVSLIHNISALSVWRSAIQNREAVAFVWFASLLCAAPLSAQLSFERAVTLAAQQSARVKVARDDVVRATAAVAESKDAYIPTFGVSGGLGRSYGITLTVPTIFTATTQSLVYSAAQKSYIRAAKQSLEASEKALLDIEQQVEEDAALAYLSLEEANARRNVILEEGRLAHELADITEKRGQAGIESSLDVKIAHRTLLQIQMLQPQVENDISTLKEHLSDITGLPPEDIETMRCSVPDAEELAAQLGTNAITPAVLSIEANALAKAQQAHGDNLYAFRPQMYMQSQYGRISPINDVSDYYNLNNRYNTIEVGISIQIPIFDKARSARARETAADAARALHDAERVEQEAREARLRQTVSLKELESNVELAALDIDIAKDQLTAATAEAQSSSASVTSGRQVTPKDVINVRLAERAKYMDWLNATLQLERGEITLLRMNGRLDEWLQLQNATKNNPACSSPQ